MSEESWYKKPSTYLGAVLLASLAMCHGEEPEVSKPKVAHVEKKEEPTFQPEVDAFGEALRQILTQSNEAPHVNLVGKEDSLYMTENALAECIQMEDNTCYLTYKFSLAFRTRLECHSNEWGKFANPIGFEVRPNPGVGFNINMFLPDGSYTSYESVPNAALNPEEAEDFYTQLCRDALEVLKQEPDQSPCDYPQDYSACRKMEDNEEWAALLGDEVQFGFESLVNEGFQVEMGPGNTLRTTFETLDGSTEAETLFPKREHCEDEEVSYNGEVCWKFKLMSGGEYTADEVLDYAVNKQLHLLEE